MPATLCAPSPAAELTPAARGERPLLSLRSCPFVRARARRLAARLRCAPAIRQAERVLRAAALAPVLSATLALACGRPATAPPDAPAQAAGWRAFEADGLYGFKDSRGEVVIPPRYQLALDFTPEGIAYVVEQDAWTCIDPRGAVLLRPYIVDNGPDPFADGRARYVEGDKLGFYDPTGAPVIPARFEFVTAFTEERAAFCVGCTRRCDGEHCSVTGGKWGLIDTRGAEVVAARFDEIGPFESGVAAAVEGGVALQIDRSGAPATSVAP